MSGLSEDGWYTDIGEFCAILKEYSLVSDGVTNSIENVEKKAKEEAWFTSIAAELWTDNHGMQPLFIYIGIDAGEDESGVETFDFNDWADSLPGISYQYYQSADEVDYEFPDETGEVMLLQVSHRPNADVRADNPGVF